MAPPVSATQASALGLLVVLLPGSLEEGLGDELEADIERHLQD